MSCVDSRICSSPSASVHQGWWSISSAMQPILLIFSCTNGRDSFWKAQVQASCVCVELRAKKERPFASASCVAAASGLALHCLICRSEESLFIHRSAQLKYPRTALRHNQNGKVWRGNEQGSRFGMPKANPFRPPLAFHENHHLLIWRIAQSSHERGGFKRWTTLFLLVSRIQSIPRPSIAPILWKMMMKGCWLMRSQFCEFCLFLRLFSFLAGRALCLTESTMVSSFRRHRQCGFLARLLLSRACLYFCKLAMQYKTSYINT